jgi:hypothetical protein
MWRFTEHRPASGSNQTPGTDRRCLKRAGFGPSAISRCNGRNAQTPVIRRGLSQRVLSTPRRPSARRMNGREARESCPCWTEVSSFETGVSVAVLYFQDGYFSRVPQTLSPPARIPGSACGRRQEMIRQRLLANRGGRTWKAEQLRTHMV